jgi:hypothetical protein
MGFSWGAPRRRNHAKPQHPHPHPHPGPPPAPPRPQAFPEVIGCRTDALRGNVGKLTKDWKLEGPVLAAAVVRNPSVLGYTLDCMGDCAGECNRCWARF